MDYKEIAKQIRKDTLHLVHKGQTSHIASCFSLTDIAVVLYENLNKEDVVVWSKGWAAALFYSIGIRKKSLDKDIVFKTFPNAPYLGLLERGVNGVVTAGGSVGHGLSVATGIALGKKRAGESGRVYVLMSDGELNEGSTWEAAMFAAHHQLDNLVAVIDKNGWQALGKTAEVMSLNPAAAFGGFGWEYFTGNGHDYEFLHKIFTQSLLLGPTAVVCDTVKGKGVSFMENALMYHYKHVDDEVFAKASEELV